MNATLTKIPKKTSFKFQFVELDNGEEILEVNGILPIPVSNVSKYLPVSTYQVKEMIKNGEVNAYNNRFELLEADYSGHDQKFINLNEWVKTKKPDSAN